MRNRVAELILNEQTGAVTDAKNDPAVEDVVRLAVMRSRELEADIFRHAAAAFGSLPHAGYGMTSGTIFVGSDGDEAETGYVSGCA
jgi:hypothetical protein